MENTNEVKNKITPESLDIYSSKLKVGDKFVKIIFLLNYPRYVSVGWFSPIVNAPELMDISLHFDPVETAAALKNLKKKTAQIEAQIFEREEQGLIRSPELETAHHDIETLRDVLLQATENLFKVSAYIALYADDESSLNRLENKISNILESRLINVKTAIFEQLSGFRSILPLNKNELEVSAFFNSSPASSFFPFVSATLTSNKGVLQGINLENNTLIIFDRFSLENANKVIFATSGSGKSYAAKLEALRELMFGTDVIIIDPENEYKKLAESVGGTFINISLASKEHVNPFDIPIIPEDENPADVLKSHIVNLAGLIKMMLGKIEPEEEALIDRAISETYAAFDIYPGSNLKNIKTPLLSDLESVLRNLEGGEKIASRLYRFTNGSYAGFSNKETNININNRLVVFSIRDLEEELRPIAMYVILNYIWNLIKSEKKKRILIVDEAWWMMKYPDGASFLFGLVKRARKYYLGVTTITQDVEDFLLSSYGRPILTNSSQKLLLKQQPAMIDTLVKTFNLTENEKILLLDAEVGEGLFFAGLKHVVIKIVASDLEDEIVSTKPAS
ncbi:MAG: DUF87 domain-containing protein [Candidatus Harrisonbacteria bacterium]|nr:DUF87 domain-containing protein [Candidatus Harrisonbacteria bacterium]